VILRRSPIGVWGEAHVSASVHVSVHVSVRARARRDVGGQQECVGESNQGFSPEPTRVYLLRCGSYAVWPHGPL